MGFIGFGRQHEEWKKSGKNELHLMLPFLQEQCCHGDYENLSGACIPKQQFKNIDWDSDSTESEEEELNYTKVSFTVTSHHTRQKDAFISDEDGITEYSVVKI